MWFEPRFALSAADQDALAQQVTGFGTLQAVLRWSFSRTPPVDVSEVVVQDEYSHDVVLRWRDDVWLGFDTT